MHGVFSDNQARRLFIVGFSAMLVLMMILGAVGLMQLRGMSQDIERVVRDTNEKIASAYLMRDAIRQRSIALRNARLTTDPFVRDAQSIRFTEVAGQYRKAWNKLQHMDMDDSESWIHRELLDLTRTSQTYNDRAMASIIDEVDGNAIDRAFHMAATVQHRLIGLLNELVELEERYAEEARMASHNNYQNTQYLMASLIGLILLAGIGIAIYITHLATRSTEQMQYQASHDSLTGLLNRREFETRLGMAIHTAKSGRVTHALLYLDLDEFKIVNDSGGHIAGDHLLKSLAAVFHSVLRRSDTVARLGGDEFGIILSDCDPDQAVLIANKLKDVIVEHQFEWENKAYAIGASIGLVTIDENADDVNSLLRYADVACYAAKDVGKNRVYVFKFEDINILRHRGQMRWAGILKEALKSSKLSIFLQPIRWADSYAKNTVDRYEVLIRLKGEKGEIIEPRKFIPAAERYHMMPEIDRWVIDQVFSLCAISHNTDSQSPLLYINLSNDSLCNSDFMNYLESRLAGHPQTARHICFEISERIVINRMKQIDEVVTRLKPYGCKFAIDHFGSGISSLYYLKNLAIDYVKIEGIFVRDLMSDKTRQDLISVVTQFCHKLGIHTVAEHVEDGASLEIIRSLGVDYVQGNTVGKPLPCTRYFNPVMVKDRAGLSDEHSGSADS